MFEYIREAQQEVRQSGNIPIPPFLQDASYPSAKKLGRGVGLLDIHSYPHHFLEAKFRGQF